jgi:hypothetical protein|tara:strand:- start:124 stop:492 length:369 start_codon:yes stop_codon:yes gene_type:complete
MGNASPVGFMDRPDIEVDLIPNAIRLRYAQAELRWAIEGIASLLVNPEEGPGMDINLSPDGGQLHNLSNFLEVLRMVGASMSVVEADLRDPQAWMQRQQRAADVSVTHAGGLAATLDRDAKH